MDADECYPRAESPRRRRTRRWLIGLAVVVVLLVAIWRLIAIIDPPMNYSQGPGGPRSAASGSGSADLYSSDSFLLYS